MGEIRRGLKKLLSNTAVEQWEAFNTVSLILFSKNLTSLLLNRDLFRSSNHTNRVNESQRALTALYYRYV